MEIMPIKYFKAFIFMRKLFLSLICLILSITATRAQVGDSQTSYTKTLKVNLNYRQDAKSVTIGNLAPALVITDKHHNFHEIELNELSIRKEDNKTINTPTGIMPGNFTKRSILKVRYQYSYSFLKDNKRLFPYLGLSMLHGYEKASYKPYVSYSFPLKNFIYSLTTSFVPGIFYTPTKRMVIDFSIPIHFFYVDIKYQRVFNPNFTLRQQRQTFVDSELRIPKLLHLRLGIGWRI